MHCVKPYQSKEHRTTYTAYDSCEGQSENFVLNLSSPRAVHVLCPVGWLVGGCGARAVSCKTPIFFIIINVADIIVAGDLSPVRIIRWTSLQSQVTIIIMINITLTFLVIGTYPVN